jgi:hypothetical protein
MQIGERYYYDYFDGACRYSYIAEITKINNDGGRGYFNVDINVVQIILCEGNGNGLGPRESWNSSVGTWTLLLGQNKPKEI